MTFNCCRVKWDPRSLHHCYHDSLGITEGVSQLHKTILSQSGQIDYGDTAVMKFLEDGLINPRMLILASAHLERLIPEINHNRVNNRAKKLLNRGIFRNRIIQQSHVEGLRRCERINKTHYGRHNIARCAGARSRTGHVEKILRRMSTANSEEPGGLS
jgi:hypothetical protein